MRKIGVFDSGVGGLSVANAIQKALPQHDVLLREDKENLPYGTKSPDQLFQLVKPIFEEMFEDGCDVIVVACNTVTTNIITELREVIKVPLIEMEPMVKPAAEQTKTGVIAVFATPATLASKRYKELKDNYCENVAVIEPDCSNWAMMIESNIINQDLIMDEVQGALLSHADVFVLGCTHYHWIEELINKLVADKAKVIQPEQPVIKQLQEVLARIA